VSIIAAENLRVSFTGRRRGDIIRAVDGVSFAVEAGQSFGIIGESGSGKSTLGRALVCLAAPSGGRVLHDGEDPFALGRRALRAHRRRFQIVFQDPNAALDPRMTILDSVREPLDVIGDGTAAERTRRALTLLDRTALSAETVRRYPHELSGGQKQRANIARALILEPRLLVCDEVVSALDVSIQAEILNLFTGLAREFNLTTIFISHDLSAVAHVSDRIAVMYFGKLVELGPAEALIAAPLHPYTDALLAAEPVPRPRRDRPAKRAPLQGEIPSPLAPPSGCRFRTRCPIATELCAAREPEWREIAAGRWVACHFAQAPSGAAA
jgi:oligopeptide/dipeptide ABC transporter ATP-binding protein